MSKYTNDSTIFKLQHDLAAAREETRSAEANWCSESLILGLMDVEDQIIEKLLSMGCHRRDC